MKTKFIIYFCFFCFGLSAQTEQANYKIVVSKFENYYNNSQYDSIFNLFDISMKKALPKEKTVSFFEQNVKAPAGAIETMQFVSTKGGGHVYRMDMEKAKFNMLMFLNANNEITGFNIVPIIAANLPKLERNSTKMILPFKEEWFVGWGGTTIEQNYHVAHKNQKYAYDLLMVKNGKTFNGNPKKNESYFIFGKEIIAPCKAKVIKVIEGVPDNTPGEMNAKQVYGNSVLLETANKEYLIFAHFKEKSIVVKEGQILKQGDLLGLCGNSGNSSEPHLHLSLQNVPDVNIATGAKLFFDRIKVNGEIKEDYLPVKNDKIQNIKI